MIRENYNKFGLIKPNYHIISPTIVDNALANLFKLF